jgi:hypothetical protein
MFTEAQLYENITRIVKLLDYKPIGYQTSTLSFQCSSNNLQAGLYTIPRYCYITVGDIAYSFNEDVSFNVPTSTNSLLSDLSNKKLLFQGLYRESPIYVSAGDKNETVRIGSPAASIDHFNIDVYVFEQQQNKWFKYKSVPTLYTEPSYTKSYEKRLASDFTYEITFGDDINGRKLQEGDKVLVYYLQSSGDTGVIGPRTISNAYKTIFSSTNYLEVLADTSDNTDFISSTEFSTLAFDNIVGSTEVKSIETPDEIRRNSPSNFKSQYRLVTKEDYETFIRINHGRFVHDVKVLSNWDYVSKYLTYFKERQVEPTQYKQIILNQVLFADSCNFNNIYVCAIPKISRNSTLKYLLPAQKEIIINDLEPLKTITSEITFLDPIVKMITFGFRLGDNTINILERDSYRIELVKRSASKRSPRSLLNDSVVILKDFFNPLNALIGKHFEYNDLLSNLLSIDGVQSIRTKNVFTNETYNNLSFFCWNPMFPDLDKTMISSNVNFLDYEYFSFENLEDISTKIQIVEANEIN